MEIKTVVLDDEPMARKLLEEELGKIAFIKVTASFSDAIEALTYIQTHKVDLLITDINMPGLNGLQLIKSLHQHPYLVISSAHRDYAADGFDLDVTDFLLKPYAFERLLKAMTKVYQKYILTQKELNDESPKQLEGTILVKSDYKEVAVELNSIKYIKALKDYVMIYTEGKSRAIITQLTMKDIEEKLPKPHFARIHRSYIVSIPKINSHNRTEIYIGEEVLPIGDLYRQTLQAQMEKVRGV